LEGAKEGGRAVLIREEPFSTIPCQNGEEFSLDTAELGGRFKQ
jgi:hypothetical protein